MLGENASPLNRTNGSTSLNDFIAVQNLAAPPTGSTDDIESILYTSLKCNMVKGLMFVMLAKILDFPN